jgi:hypothetical protein
MIVHLNHHWAKQKINDDVTVDNEDDHNLMFDEEEFETAKFFF